jgi:hypothetical protein
MQVLGSTIVELMFVSTVRSTLTWRKNPQLDVQRSLHYNMKYGLTLLGENQLDRVRYEKPG